MTTEPMITKIQAPVRNLTAFEREVWFPKYSASVIVDPDFDGVPGYGIELSADHLIRERQIDLLARMSLEDE